MLRQHNYTLGHFVEIFCKPTCATEAGMSALLTILAKHEKRVALSQQKYGPSKAACIRLSAVSDFIHLTLPLLLPGRVCMLRFSVTRPIWMIHSLTCFIKPEHLWWENKRLCWIPVKEMEKLIWRQFILEGSHTVLAALKQVLNFKNIFFSQEKMELFLSSYFPKQNWHSFFATGFFLMKLLVTT